MFGFKTQKYNYFLKTTTILAKNPYFCAREKTYDLRFVWVLD